MPIFRSRAGGGGQFDLAIVAGSGVRRWVRRQADVVVDGVRPFLPLPAKLCGPSDGVGAELVHREEGASMDHRARGGRGARGTRDDHAGTFRVG